MKPFMIISMQVLHLAASIWTIASISLAEAQPQRATRTCEYGYQLCDPTDRETYATPRLGGTLSSLYIGLLDAVAGMSIGGILVTASTENPQARDGPYPVCCTWIKS